MSWCFSIGSAWNFSPGESQRSVPKTFFAPASRSFRISVASPCGVFTRGSWLVSMKVSVVVMAALGLNPDAAVDAVPPQIVGSAVQDVGLEAIGRLEFEVEQSGLGGTQAVLGFRWNKN